MHTLGTYIKGWAETNRFSAENAALISFWNRKFKIVESWSSSTLKLLLSRFSSWCIVQQVRYCDCTYSLEISPLPQVFSPEGWRTRGGVTMIVRACLIQRCCTQGEWLECYMIKREVEPTFSAFQTTHSIAPSTHAPHVFTQRFLAQNTKFRLLVVTITMYRVLFVMLQPEILKWWFLPGPAALRTGRESTTAIYRVKQFGLIVNPLSTFVWTKNKSQFVDHTQISMEPYYIMWEPHAVGLSALHTTPTRHWHVPYVPSKYSAVNYENTVKQ